VPKANGIWKVCTDFRIVNSATKNGCFLYLGLRTIIIINFIGSLQFVSKFDLLKGYRQVPLSEQATAISAFETLAGLYQYIMMPVFMIQSKKHILYN